VENLLIDIGNTSVKAAFANGDILEDSVRYEGTDVVGFVSRLLSSREVSIVAISSVRDFPSGYFFPLEALCRKLLIFDHNIPIPLVNHYETPSTLGSDRLLSALAASFLFPGLDSIVFDFGTALTIDFVSAKREFYGGNISPGLETRFNALSDYTGKLPRCSRPNELMEQGRHTKGAIESGVVLGLIFEVEGYMDKYKDHFFIFTGGDANYFAEKVKKPIFVVYNLVLMGLAHVAKDYA
jgi:type III pantothenate kinase